MDFELTKVPDTAAQPEEESPWGTLARGIVRSGARAVETVLGLPGDITEGITSVVHAGRKAITGKEQGPIKIDLSSGLLKSINEGIKRFTGYESPLPETFSLPNSQDIKEYITQPLGKAVLPEGYLEPKSDWETVSDAIISDAIPLLIPVKGKVPFARALKVSGLSNLASWLTKEFGGSEQTQAATKLGTTLLTSLGNPFALKKYANTLKPNEAKAFLKEVNASSKILNTLNKYTSKTINPITGVLVGAYYGKGVPSALGIAGLFGAGIFERTLRAFSKNPDLRKFYMSTLQAAARQNAPLIAKNIKKLDDEVAKIEQESDGDFEITNNFEITKLPA